MKILIIILALIPSFTYSSTQSPQKPATKSCDDMRQIIITNRDVLDSYQKAPHVVNDSTVFDYAMSSYIVEKFTAAYNVQCGGQPKP